MTLAKLIRRFTASLVLTGSVLALAADTSAATRFYVRVGPPRPIVERRVVAPGPRHVWVPGFYRWDARRYAWTPGYWAVPPRARAVWVPGHWVRERRGWYFVDGYWR
jgi:hypothetical protein